MPHSWIDTVIRHAGDPTLRIRALRKFLRTFPLGSFETRLAVGGFDRPWYAWCLFHASMQAKTLGHKAITALELGVAGGNGLRSLCRYRDEIERVTGVKIFVSGLDAGTGLPASSDARDLLYCWPAGSFEMDYPKLRKNLGNAATLILGDVKETAQSVDIPSDAPLGAIMFDLDLFTSTRDAFALFDHPNLLPRVWCYFDDIVGGPENLYSDYTGVREAIREFNSARAERGSHLSQAYVFRGVPPEEWHSQIYAYHRLRHPDYSRCLSDHRHTLDLLP